MKLLLSGQVLPCKSFADPLEPLVVLSTLYYPAYRSLAYSPRANCGLQENPSWPYQRKYNTIMAHSLNGPTSPPLLQPVFIQALPYMGGTINHRLGGFGGHALQCPHSLFQYKEESYLARCPSPQTFPLWCSHCCLKSPPPPGDLNLRSPC